MLREGCRFLRAGEIFEGAVNDSAGDRFFAVLHQFIDELGQSIALVDRIWDRFAALHARRLLDIVLFLISFIFTRPFVRPAHGFDLALQDKPTSKEIDFNGILELLRFFRPVFGAGFFPVFDRCAVERAADDVVANAREGLLPCRRVRGRCCVLEGYGLLLGYRR